MGIGTFVVVGGFQTITTFDENLDFGEFNSLGNG